MSVRLAAFLASLFDRSDWPKLLVIVGAMVALYVLAKRLGGGDEPVPPPTDTQSSAPFSNSDTDPVEPHESQDIENDPDQHDLEEQPIAEDEDVQPRNIQITDWNFASFEIATGPPDRNCFADELSLNLYDKSSGHAWDQTYFVATPSGIEKMLRESKASFMFLAQVLVMNRYDVNRLRKAVLDDLGAMEEERGYVPPDASDDAAAGQ